MKRELGGGGGQELRMGWGRAEAPVKATCSTNCKRQQCNKAVCTLKVTIMQLGKQELQQLWTPPLLSAEAVPSIRRSLRRTVQSLEDVAIRFASIGFT